VRSGGLNLSHTLSGKRADVPLLSPCSHSFLGLLPDHNALNAYRVQGLGCKGRARPSSGVEQGPSEWPHGSRRTVASSCRGGRCSGLSEACLRGAGLVGEPLEGKGVGTQLERPPVRPVSESLGEIPALRVWGALPPSIPPAERGVKLGSHRGERKGKKVVEPLGYVGGAPEGAAEGAHCSSTPAAVALAHGPLEVAGTLLGTGRMAGRPRGGRGGGLDLGGRISPQGFTIHFEGQAEDTMKMGGSLCSPWQEAGPAAVADGSILLVTGRLAGRLGLRDCSLLGAMVGSPSRGAACARGQTGGPGEAVSSSCSWQGVGWRGVWCSGLRGLHALSNTEPQTEGWKGPQGPPSPTFHSVQIPFAPSSINQPPGTEGSQPTKVLVPWGGRLSRSFLGHENLPIWAPHGAAHALAALH